MHIVTHALVQKFVLCSKNCLAPNKKLRLAVFLLTSAKYVQRLPWFVSNSCLLPGLPVLNL